jgi:hypothetical protein
LRTLEAKRVGRVPLDPDRVASRMVLKTWQNYGPEFAVQVGWSLV